MYYVQIYVLCRIFIIDIACFAFEILLLDILACNII